MTKKKLQIAHLERKMRAFESASQVPPPPTGWTKTVRMALGITLQQLANRLSVSKQSVRSMEQREIEGGITLQSMRELARALDMQFVYGFVPKDGTLDALIERRAREIAREIVSRTSNSMQLEDQQNSAERLRQAVNEHTEALIREMPKFLWD